MNPTTVALTYYSTELCNLCYFDRPTDQLKEITSGSLNSENIHQKDDKKIRCIYSGSIR